MTNHTPVIRCGCCGLRFEEPIPGSVVNGDGHCIVCKQHQSSEINQTVKRHREHEEALRVRLEKAMAWAEQVASEIKEAKQNVYWSYRTRDRAAKLLQQVADVHSMRPDATCVCKAKNCRVAKILDDGLARKLISDVDKVQDDMRRREQLMRELRFADLDEIDDVLDGFGYLDQRRDTA